MTRLAALLWLATCPVLTMAAVSETGPDYPVHGLRVITTLPAAGSQARDPAFGTRIMRLTDGADGSTSCVNAYSYWPVFNRDSTRLVVQCAFPEGPVRTIFYRFDAAHFSFDGYRFVPYLSSDLIWSAREPDLMFTRSGPGGNTEERAIGYGRILNTYDVATGETRVIHDFTAELPGFHGLNQMSRSMDDDVWAFTVVDARKTFVGYLVWKRSTGQVWRGKSDRNVLDEMQIDKSGRYLNIQNKNGNARVLDLTGSRSTQLKFKRDGYYHEDTGFGGLVSGCGGSPSLCFRSLDRPKAQAKILDVRSWSQADNHYSMLADDGGWALVINEHPDYAVTLPFHGEIFQVATDGSGRVRRLVHHNSSVREYSRSAFGNISRDGRFIAWTSDWGDAGGRTDVYLAQIEPAP